MPINAFTPAGFPGSVRMAILAISLALAVCQSTRAADAPAGAQVYRQKCASCHGPAGQGTEKHPEALAGDRSVAELGKFIAKRMPENDPGSLSKEEAERVAAY